MIETGICKAQLIKMKDNITEAKFLQVAIKITSESYGTVYIYIS